MTLKVRSLRRWIISLVTIGTILNCLARSLLSVAAYKFHGEKHV